MTIYSTMAKHCFQNLRVNVVLAIPGSQELQNSPKQTKIYCQAHNGDLDEL